MKRHKNLWLSCDEDDVDYRIRNEACQRRLFASPHEMYAILQEELEEFWDSIKADDPDPSELLQICAVAKSALLQLCAQAREETGWAGRGEVKPLVGKERED